MAEDVMDDLVQASFTVIALVSQVAAANDMSLTQFRVLAVLRDREPMISELATHLGLERSSVSGLIDRSVKRGLAQRTASTQDARSVRVSLTPAGHELGERLTAQMGELLAPMLGKLGTAERNRLSVLLRRMLD
jgi:DNA-binding MarR family transcriptional regulator